MSTNEPCQRPSTKETQISLPNPRMQAPDAGAIDPDTKGILSLSLAQTGPHTATSHAGAENAIPRFCVDVAKPCSFPLMLHIFSGRSRTSLSQHDISGSPKFCLPYRFRRFGAAREALRGRLYLFQLTRWS
jgi:hypothetical protein